VNNRFRHGVALDLAHVGSTVLVAQFVDDTNGQGLNPMLPRA